MDSSSTTRGGTGLRRPLFRHRRSPVDGRHTACVQRLYMGSLHARSSDRLKHTVRPRSSSRSSGGMRRRTPQPRRRPECAWAPGCWTMPVPICESGWGTGRRPAEAGSKMRPALAARFAALPTTEEILKDLLTERFDRGYRVLLGGTECFGNCLGARSGRWHISTPAQWHPRGERRALSRRT
jgi:hypothetical protein